jgi:hypothetical protein
MTVKVLENKALNKISGTRKNTEQVWNKEICIRRNFMVSAFLLPLCSTESVIKPSNMHVL